MKLYVVATLAASALGASGAQAASSDYLLEIDGIKGESVAPAAVESWSFGVCDTGQCSGTAQRTIVTSREAGSGMASGKAAYDKCCIPTASQNSQSLRESPSKSSLGRGQKPPSTGWDLGTLKGARTTAGGANVVAGDLDGDGRADLAFAASQPDITDLTLTFHKIPVEYQAACSRQHIARAVLRGASDSFELTDVMVTCAQPSATKTIDQTPARISTNMTTPRQTQGATFGERCTSGACDALTDGLLIMRFTSGQMKYAKTGHVTLMK